MASSAKYTIVLKVLEYYRKVLKIFIGSDGSYYVTVPYHEAKKAVLLKATCNYDSQQTWLPFDQCLDVASLDEGRLKLSHHPDGFVQFSGEGVLSGLDGQGRPKGIGVFSSPLSEVGRGPAFSVCIQGVDKLELAGSIGKTDVVFDSSLLGPVPEANGVVLEGHYFQPHARRFLRRHPDGWWYLDVQHPAGPVIRLRAILAGTDCKYPGFIGLEMYPATLGFPESGYTLNGPGERHRINAAGETVADLLFCMYPRMASVPVRRSLDF